MVGYEKAKVHGGGSGWERQGSGTNRNKLGVDFNLKKSKPQSHEIEVVVCANKVAYTLMAKLNFLCISSQIMSVMGKMDLGCKA